MPQFGMVVWLKHNVTSDHTTGVPPYLGVGPFGVVVLLELRGPRGVLGAVWGVRGPLLDPGVEGADLGVLGVVLAAAAGDLGVLGLPQPSRVLSVILLGWGLVFPCGVRFSSGPDMLGVFEDARPVDPSFSFSCTAGMLAWRGTGEAVLPLAECLFPFFSLVEDGVTISSGGRSFNGVPSSPSSNDTKEQ